MTLTMIEYDINNDFALNYTPFHRHTTYVIITNISINKTLSQSVTLSMLENISRLILCSAMPLHF